MALLVLAYPDLSKRDLEWIQSIRAEYDELYYHVVRAHFTIVFPVFNVGTQSFISHVKRKVEGLAAFHFVLRCAVLDKDAFNEYTNVFLVPDEGYSTIVKLHDRLYTDLLASDLRLDLPFIPHVGIANAVDPKKCKNLADELNAKDFEISGKIDVLDAVWYENNEVKTLERITLA